MNLKITDAPRDESQISEQRWYYQKSDGTLLPYTDTMNRQMNKAFVGAVITFSEKNQKYSVAKKSWNTAEQINLSTKRHRPVFSQYELNVNGNDDEKEQTASDKFDELIGRLSLNQDTKQKELNAAKHKLEELLKMLETNDSVKDDKVKKLEKMVEEQSIALDEQSKKLLDTESNKRHEKTQRSESVKDELMEEIRHKQEVIDRLTVSASDLQNEMDVILKTYRYAILFVVLISATTLEQDVFEIFPI